MRNKLIALMAVIPLIVMFTIMTFTESASVAVSIPVSGVEISTETENGVLTIDMAEYEYDDFLRVDVKPEAAANREYDLEFSAVEGSEQGEIEVEEDGLIVPVSPGAVKVTAVTRDGGFRASIVINVVSTKALGATVSVSGREEPYPSYEVKPADEDAGYDYALTLPGGSFLFETRAIPTSVSADVTYSVLPEEGSEHGFEIHPVTGLAYARLSGSYLVTATLDPAVEGREKVTVLVTVDCGDGFTVQGSAGSVDERLLPGTGSTVIYAESDTAPVAKEPFGEGISEVSVERADGTERGWAVTVVFDDKAAENGASLTLESAGESVTVNFVFTEPVLEIYGRYTDDGGTFLQKTGMTASYAAVAEPAMPDGTTYRFEVSGGAAEIVSQDPDTGICRVRAVAAGEAVIVLYVTENGEEREAARESLVVADGYSSFTFAENAQTWGIGGVYAVGGMRYEGGAFVTDERALSVTAHNGAVSTVPSAEDVVFTSSDPSVAEVGVADGHFVVRAKGTGRVTFTAKWRYSDLFLDGVSASITVDVVADGVNVTDYTSLMAATDAEKPVVLQEDVMLGEYMFDEDGFLKEDADLSRFVRQIETTADWTYYANQGKAHPTVNYIVEFTADVYGNGKYIDGDYITQVTPMVSAAKSVFKGPLDFVAYGAKASVKAQDNIVFLVRTDDIVIDNVVLRGCSDESLYDDDKMELNLLNTVGTVIEVMSDCRILNSRIMNGRTGLRALGRKGIDAVVSESSPVDVEKERIDVAVESCIIQNAREFLVKLGTNRKVRGTYVSGASSTDWDEEAMEPSLSANGVTYAPRDDSNLYDENFADNFVLTHLTLENCALYNSGLFSVGFESSFAGPMLDGFWNFTYWDDIGGTSYSAVLKLVGDVRMYDWKSLDTVDSSTLIEVAGDAGSSADFLRLDVSAMLNRVCTYGGDEYKDIIYTADGSQYVHGGIAMYGGGKNYGMVDLSEFTGEVPEEYHVNLSVLALGEGDDDGIFADQARMLPLAAGTQDFRFFMYDATSTFGYAAQREAFANGTAFSYITAAQR